MAGEIDPDPNPVTTVWKTVGTLLIREETPEKPVTITTTWDIVQEQAKLDKLSAAEAKWTDKKTEPQAILDKYQEEAGKGN